MTVNTQFPSARPALARAGRAAKTERRLVGVFSFGGGQSLGDTQVDSILIKFLKSGAWVCAYLDYNVLNTQIRLI